MPLTPAQTSLATAPLDAKLFLSGPAGTGKTTAAVERLLHLMAQGVRADSILLIVPQRTLAMPYYEALSYPGVVAGGVVSVLTVGGLAQRMVELFWPLAAEQAGFAFPDEPPTFLTLETAQYYMARLVRPLLDQGYFESVTISRNRLYSQIIDNLNKAAVVGFAYNEIGPRLKSAWIGEASQVRIYDDAQDCASRFRAYCLAHNLLDFSLQLEVFVQHLWPNSLCRDYLTRTYRCLIADNLEEDTPVAHDLLRAWLPDFDSALLVYDHDAGYRRFLGTDPQSGYGLRDLCGEHIVFDESFVTSPALEDFGARLGLALDRRSIPLSPHPLSPPPFSLSFAYLRYFPQMLDWVAGQIANLVHEEGTPPGEIVVLAPFLPDALRFSLTERLSRLGVPSRSHRPSRALREEPPAQCLLTLSMLAHPQWGLSPSRFDVAYALIQSIADMDLVRAQLLAEIVYRVRDGRPALSSFDRIKPDMQERITFGLGQRYEALRAWLDDYAARPEEEFDYFLSRLFGEILSQPGFGFHANYTTGEVAANLIESARKFRWAVTPLSPPPYPFSEGVPPSREKPLGQEYLSMVQDGVVAAQYIQSWQIETEDAVLLAPAYTFLMRNRPVDYQFWLDVGSRGWFERLYQPLTHPYVLSRQWAGNTVWSDLEEHEASQETLYRLALGLIRRCRRKVYLGLSEMNEQGNDQKGPLLKAIQRVLRQNTAIPTEDEEE